jgi:hypothetical protein
MVLSFDAAGRPAKACFCLLDTYACMVGLDAFFAPFRRASLSESAGVSFWRPPRSARRYPSATSSPLSQHHDGSMLLSMLIDCVSDLGRNAIEVDWRSYLDHRWRTTSGHYNRADTRALLSGRSTEREGLRGYGRYGCSPWLALLNNTVPQARSQRRRDFQRVLGRSHGCGPHRSLVLYHSPVMMVAPQGRKSVSPCPHASLQNKPRTPRPKRPCANSFATRCLAPHSIARGGN